MMAFPHGDNGHKKDWDLKLPNVGWMHMKTWQKEASDCTKKRCTRLYSELAAQMWLYRKIHRTWSVLKKI